MVSYQGYLVKNSLADFSKIPSRGRAGVPKSGGAGQVLLTAPCQGVFLMHRLEPACNHIRVGAEARALAPQLDANLTVANAINKAAGDDLAADGQRVECYLVALLGCLNHREIRHLLNDARNQRCLIPCDQGLAIMLDNKLIAALGQAIAYANR